jgi:hypothetical protein
LALGEKNGKFFGGERMIRKFIFLSVFLLFVGSNTLAHWDPGDDYKMHYPQMPDPLGWDVDFGPDVPQLADDWMCSESGYVEDFHFWCSWQDDLLDGVTGVYATIWDDDRSGPYSKPGTQLWSALFKAENFTIRHYGTGDQGWYDPVADTWIENDHTNYYQINVTYIPNPFYQIKDTIYWLGICVTSENEVGWRTSVDHFEDHAVWWDGSAWQELRDPTPPYESLDMAFVITPEPATICLLGLGTLLLRRRKNA